MGASYPLADLMAALEMQCHWWHTIHFSEHDDMHGVSLKAVSLYDGHFRSSFVGAYSSQFFVFLYGGVGKMVIDPSG